MAKKVEYKLVLTFGDEPDLIELNNTISAMLANRKLFPTLRGQHLKRLTTAMTKKTKKTKADANNPGTVTELKTMGILPPGESPGSYPAIGPDDTWESLKDHPEVKAKAAIIAVLIKAGKHDLANAVAKARFDTDRPKKAAEAKGKKQVTADSYTAKEILSFINENESSMSGSSPAMKLQGDVRSTKFMGVTFDELRKVAKAVK